MTDSEPPAKPHAFAVATLAMVVIVIGTVIGWWTLLPEIAPKRIVIAVLPFAELGPEPDQRFLAEGIAADVQIGLSQIPEFIVLTRRTTFDRRPVDVRKLADQLGATHAVGGTVSRDGDDLGVAARLTDLSDLSVLWADEWDATMDDVATIRDSISRGVAEKLLLFGEVSVTAGPAIDGPAYEIFLRARARGDAGDTAAASEFAMRSLQLEPGNPYAHYYLAILARDRAPPVALGHLDATLEADASFIRARPLQARLRFLENYDAVAYYQALAEAAIHQRDPETLGWLADLYAAGGRRDDAVTLRRYLGQMQPGVTTRPSSLHALEAGAVARIPWQPVLEILFPERRTPPG